MYRLKFVKKLRFYLTNSYKGIFCVRYGGHEIVICFILIYFYLQVNILWNSGTILSIWSHQSKKTNMHFGWNLLNLMFLKDNSANLLTLFVFSSHTLYTPLTCILLYLCCAYTLVVCVHVFVMYASRPHIVVHNALYWVFGRV